MSRSGSEELKKSPTPSPAVRECLSKKTQIDKKVKTERYSISNAVAFKNVGERSGL